MAEKKRPLDKNNAGSGKGNNNQQKKKRSLLRKIIFAVIIVFILAGLAATAVGVSYIWDTPPIDRALLEIVRTSIVLDNQGEEVASLHGEENRVFVPLAEIPRHVQDAVIAIEDERFDSHFGFDIIGFARAVWVNLRERRFAEGASTITQQLVQNAFLTPERTIRRKAQEIWLAIQFERLYSKEEILEMYLNRVYFGWGAYGVEAAAQTYFAKSVGELEIHEAALLAALLRAPEHYNPFANKEAGLVRMRLALGNMRRLNFISDSQYRQAMSAELVHVEEPPTFVLPHPYFLDYVVHHELPRILGEMPQFRNRTEIYQAIYGGGLRIYTTMDTHLQGHVESVIANKALYPRTIYIDTEKLSAAINANNPRLPRDFPAAYIDEEKGKPQPQAALVLACPQTGEIWALGGGRNYVKGRDEVLRFRSERQAGSAIKPLLVYAPAIEEGLLGAGSALDDAPFLITRPEPWTPENFDGQFRGMVSVRRALAHSLNIPAVRAYQALGLEKGAAYAYRMGLSTLKTSPQNPALPSWSLGGRDVTALDMTQAYAVLANNGVRVDLHVIRRIEDKNGQVIYENKFNPVQVLSPQTAFIVNDILRDVVRHTTARGLRAPRPMAAKTGTTDDARDVYLSAYAPNVVATVWMGYDIKIMGNITRGWGFTTGMLREVFNEVFKTLPVEQFNPAPRGVVRVEVCAKSGLLPGEHCREGGEIISDYFLAAHAPRVTCNMCLLLEICAESGMLAGEYCPEESVIRQVFFNRPEFITTDGRWRRGAGRAPLDAQNMPPTETCTLHTELTSGLTSFTAEVRNNEIRLAWEYIGRRVREFKIYRQIEAQTGSSLLATLTADQRRYADRDLQPGNTYIYSLYAVYEHGPSEPALARVRFGEARPAAPENFTATRIANGVRLEWGYPSGTGIERFIISRQLNGGAPIQLQELLANRRDYVDQNIPGPGLYTYRIVAVRQNVVSEAATAEIVIPAENSSNSNSGGVIASFIGRFLRLRAVLP